MSASSTQSSFIDREVYRKKSRRRLRASEPEQNSTLSHTHSSDCLFFSSLVLFFARHSQSLRRVCRIKERHKSLIFSPSLFIVLVEIFASGLEAWKKKEAACVARSLKYFSDGIEMDDKDGDDTRTPDEKPKVINKEKEESIFGDEKRNTSSTSYQKSILEDKENSK